MSRFLSVEELLLIHDQAIESSGGSHGIRDVGLLQSALGAPQQTFGGEFLHHGAFAQAGALLRSIALNHPFLDGNKRTALMSAYVFLSLNGWVLDAPDIEAIEFMVEVASKKPSVEDVATWLKARSRRA